MKILQIIPGSQSYGGIERLLDNIFSRYNYNDEIDFVCLTYNSLRIFSSEECPEKYSFTELRSSIGSRYLHSISDVYEIVRMLRQYCKHRTYDVIHIHGGNIFIIVTVLLGVKKNCKIVVHSHGQETRFFVGNFVRRLLKKVIYYLGCKYVDAVADLILACSGDALLSTFGHEPDGKYQIFKNAINVTEFDYNPNVRESFGLNDSTIVFASIGRLVPVKSIPFALNVFSNYHKNNPDSVYWIIGDGVERQKIEEAIQEKSLSSFVKFYGNVENVNDYLQRIDILLFPSLYEGLGISAIEAQCAGVEVIASSNVPKEVDVTGLVHFFDIHDSAIEWATCVDEIIKSKQNRSGKMEALSSSGYDINDAVKHLHYLYISLCENYFF